jgi:hypothetical protein
MVHLAQSIGPHTVRLFERILADKPHPEMGYRSCLVTLQQLVDGSALMSSMRSPFSIAENIYTDFLYTLVGLRDVKLSCKKMRPETTKRIGCA